MLVFIGAMYLLLFVAWLVEIVLIAGNDYKTTKYNFVAGWILKGLCGKIGFCSLTFLSLASYALLGVLFLTAVFIVILPMSSFVLIPLGVFSPENPWDFYSVGGTLWAIFTALGYVLLDIKYDITDNIKSKLPKSTSKPKKPNVFLKGVKEWYKQHKEKYCPIVEKGEE